MTLREVSTRDESLWCSSQLVDAYGNERDRTCARAADRLVVGRPYCWQHGSKKELELEREARKERGVAGPRDYVKVPEDYWEFAEELDASDPFKGYSSWRYRLFGWLAGVGERIHPRLYDVIYMHPCEVCGRQSRHRVLFTHPLHLRRMYANLCRRSHCERAVKAWEGKADARRRRAQMDWEREHPLVAAADLVSYIPPQYPSVTRATLRRFVDSGEDVATVTGDVVSVGSLNGSIRSLGFSDEVYAELRSGQTVLRRIVREETTSR